MEIPMTIIGCATCGISFCITEDYEERRREDHKYFYCPSGHSQNYPNKSELELMKAERDQAIRLEKIAYKELTKLKKKKHIKGKR